ncbi:MAG: tRNA lysidine(34) synthetase TilS, partial [Acidobacteria bacterium]|nr:tRNA lysidine(34) synthetase TilS [Acidobacteriota bacterium]
MVAFSGGPDSLALLAALVELAPSLDLTVLAAHYDHRLDPDSTARAERARALSSYLGVPCHLGRREDGPEAPPPGSPEAAARRLRYGFLDRVRRSLEADFVLTAHHADDQAETLLLRLNRASGVAGLAGARARGTVPETEIPLLRPLLDWRRAELVAIVESTGIEAAQDPSNEDDRFDRARLRKALAGADWLDVGAMAESASHLADADAA